MTLLENPKTQQSLQVLVLRCKACDWVLSHQNVMYGHCPRCGRYIPV